MPKAVFLCAVCGGQAGEVELTEDRLMVSGPVCTLTTNPYGMEDVTALASAIEDGNPLRLYEIEEEYAPFYCPDCDACYCRSHWRIEVDFDSDFPGWYDCSYGSCPKDHRRKLDD